MKYETVTASELAEFGIEISAAPKKTKDEGGDTPTVTEANKNEFFKLYTQLSRKVKKMVGKKKNGKFLKLNFDHMLEAMRHLVEEK